MRLEHQLLLKHEDFASKVTQLFREVNADPATRQVFIENPTGLISSRILPPELAEAFEPRASYVNRFLFSVLANKKFHDWFLNYQKSLVADLKRRGETQADLEKIKQDVARAMLKFGDENLILTLVDHGDRNAELAGTSVRGCGAIAVENIAFAVNVILVFKFYVSTDYIAVLGPSNDPLDIQLTPGQVRSIASQVVKHAQALSRSGALKDPDIEFA